MTWLVAVGYLVVGAAVSCACYKYRLIFDDEYLVPDRDNGNIFMGFVWPIALVTLAIVYACKLYADVVRRLCNRT